MCADTEVQQVDIAQRQMQPIDADVPGRFFTEINTSLSVNVTQGLSRMCSVFIRPST